MRLFLSNSGRRMSRRVTICPADNLPAKVLKDLLLLSSTGTIPLGKHDLLIKHALDPESKSTLNNLRLLMHPIVLQMHMDTGVSLRCWTLGPL